jgi:hypothetical protein
MLTGFGRSVRVAGYFVVLAGGLLAGGGCSTGGGVPQQLEPTKSRMDREVETDRPAPTTENAKAAGTQ